MLFITNEWIDIIDLDIETKKAIRRANNDSGTFKEEQNNFIIIWDKWGEEIFYKKNDISNTIYYNCNIPFELYLESNYWNDIGVFNLNDNIIYRKYKANDKGIFYFKEYKLYIEWESTGIEIFNQLSYGKIYSSTTFGMTIKKHNLKEIKIIAIVFPQFHEIPENNKFWGNGFTEWTLLKNIPRIVNGQIIKQPHNDIGYFNLKDYDHRKYMRILADTYNIYGFCYYHYWFKNKKIMYEPTELMLLDDEPNKPFFFCWANEQWTKRWDGGNSEILIEQDYDDNIGNINHFYYLLQFFRHKNYIKKYNKPIFIFYRIEEKDVLSIKNILQLWNNLAIKEGFDGIHFMRFLGPFNNNINLDEINSYVNFQPGYTTSNYFSEIISEDNNKIFNEYNENIYLDKNNDIKELVDKKILSSGYDHYKNINEKEKKYRTSKFFVYDGELLYENIIKQNKKYNEEHRGISVEWNNTPRRNYTNTEYNKYPHYYKNINPNLFGNYFYKLLQKIQNTPNKESDYLFISAWNEWNEQAILEPNNEDGYNYLNIIKNKYLEFYDYPKKKNVLNICHKGGGTEKYMNDLKNIFIQYNFIDFDKFDIEIDYSKIYTNIDIIHINSILFNNLSKYYIYFIEKFFKQSKIFVTIHDYQWFFIDKPNIEMEIFESCLMNNTIYIDMFEKLLTLASIIIFPSINIYNNYNLLIDLNKYKNKINIVNHPDKIINNNFLVINDIEKIESTNIDSMKSTNIDSMKLKLIKTINIAYIGYFVGYKGANILKKIAQKHNKYIDNNFEVYNIKYHVYGNLNEDDCTDINNIGNMIFHNKYNDDQIIELLHNKKINGIVHLSLFEESYCYSLTNSINSGLPIFYLNRGSLKERLDNKCKYHPTDLSNINENFEKFIKYIIDITNNKDTSNRNYLNYYKLNDTIQPNKWYLMNYN